MSHIKQLNRPFVAEFQVAWADLDYNRHLKNTAYFDYAAQTRFLYLNSAGFGPRKMAQIGVGPAILTETITYRKELQFLEPFCVELLMDGEDQSGKKQIFVNRFLNGDGQMTAELKTTFVWLDLKIRKAVVPPQELAAAINALPRANVHEES